MAHPHIGKSYEGNAPIISSAVLPTTLDAILAEAARRGVTRSRVIREILAAWAESRQEAMAS